jgi:tetratricopeptide (TPR) repeat protein
MNILIRNKKFLRFFLMILVFAAVGCVCIYAQSNKIEKPELKTLEQVKILLDEGFEHLKLEQYTQAKSKFEDALKIAPEDMKGEINNLISQVDDMVGRESILAGETIQKSEQEAEKISNLKQQILEFEKTQKEREKRRIINLHIDKGKFYYEQGKYREALDEFNRVLTMEPENEASLQYIEETKTAMEQVENREEREEVLAMNEQLTELWKKAKQYYHDKRYDDAIEEFKKVLAIEPTNTDAMEYMELAKEMKLFGEKIEEAEKLEDMVNKGKEYFRDRDYDKAVDMWEEVLEEKENYPGIEILIAQAELAEIKGARRVVAEKQKTVKEDKMLEIEKAYVPITVEVDGGKTEKGRTEANEQLQAIEELRKKAKEQKVSLEFIDADLRSVISFLSRQSGINMAIDETVFAQEMQAGATGGAAPAGGGAGRAIAIGGGGVGIGGAGAAETQIAQVPVQTYNVNVSLRDIPLLDALNLILRPRGLDYEIRPNVIWISTRDRIENVPLEAMETKIFDLQFGGPFRGQVRPEPLELKTTLEEVKLGTLGEEE